jgi:hypothetical protein
MSFTIKYNAALAFTDGKSYTLLPLDNTNGKDVVSITVNKFVDLKGKDTTDVVVQSTDPGKTNAIVLKATKPGFYNAKI